MVEQFFKIWIGDADEPSQIGGAIGKDFREACLKVCGEIPGFDHKLLRINNMMLYENAERAQADWGYRMRPSEAPSGLEAGEVGI